MPTQSGVVIPQELAALRGQKSQLWTAHDASVAANGELERLAAQVSEGGPAREVEGLSRTETPPDELAAAVDGLRTQLQKITRLDEELREAERRRFNRILTGVCVGAGLLLALIVGVIVAVTGK